MKHYDEMPSAAVDALLARSSPRKPREVDLRHGGELTFTSQLNWYDQEVLQLAAGDTVVFAVDRIDVQELVKNPDLTVRRGDRAFTVGDFKTSNGEYGHSLLLGKKKFRLGKYLGAGNTTHVWELADEPGKVLRIPFHVLPLRKQDDGFFLVHKPDQFLAFYVAVEPKYVSNRARILSSGPSYAVQEKINAGETGANFLNRIAPSLEMTPADANFSTFEVLQKNIKKLNRADQSRLRELSKAMSIWQKDSSRNYTNQSKQMVWDLDNNRWVLVDWE